MVTALSASKLRNGMVIKWNNGLFKVQEIEFRGTGKSAKMIQTRLHDLEKNLNIEHRFDADEKIEEIELERASFQYIYNDQDLYYFMDTVSFEQIPVHKNILGPATSFIKPETVIQAELYEGRIVNIVLPEFLELKVTTAPPSGSEGGNNTFKEITLENGVKILAPHFIKEGDTVRVDWAHSKYVDRIISTK